MNGLLAVKQQQQEQQRNPLLDLLDLDLGGGDTVATTTAALPAASFNALDDILGLNLGNSLPPAPSYPAATAATGFGLLDGLGGGGSVPVISQNGGGGGINGLDNLLNGMDALSFAAVSGGGGVGPLTAYEKHGLRILFTFPGPYTRAATTVTLLAYNLTQQPIHNFVFQVHINKEHVRNITVFNQ